MRSLNDPILAIQLPYIARIIRDETWLEGERRGQPVSPDDPVVLARVCDIVLRVGADLREHVTRTLTAAAGDRSEAVATAEADAGEIRLAA